MLIAGTLGRTLIALVLLVSLGTGCRAAPNVVDPAAQPIVDMIGASPSPRLWGFTYQAKSHSPYGACLIGIDEVTGVIDVDSGAMLLEPNRNAPAVIVTPSSFMVRRSGSAPLWDEIEWTPGDNPATLHPVFGEVLANFISTGLREPDLAMTALAAIDIAATVELVADPIGNPQTIKIEVDSDLYFQGLEAEGEKIDDGERPPILFASVDELGRVIKIVVDTAPVESDSEGLRDAYNLTATYDNVEAVTLPASTQRQEADLESIQYPSPEQSCVFGM